MVRQHLVTLIVALGVFGASDSAGQPLPPGTRTEEDASKAVMMIEFYGTPMKNVIAVIGAGSIGQAVARRVAWASMWCWLTCATSAATAKAAIWRMELTLSP